MISRRKVPFGLRLAGALLTGLTLLAIVPAAAPGEGEETREQQISDLEKQIQELNKKLEELKKQQAATAAAAGQEGLPADWTKQLHWRCIGPAAMGGRFASDRAGVRPAGDASGLGVGVRWGRVAGVRGR